MIKGSCAGAGATQKNTKVRIEKKSLPFIFLFCGTDNKFSMICTASSYFVNIIK